MASLPPALFRGTPRHDSLAGCHSTLASPGTTQQPKLASCLTLPRIPTKNRFLPSAPADLLRLLPLDLGPAPPKSNSKNVNLSLIPAKWIRPRKKRASGFSLDPAFDAKEGRRWRMKQIRGKHMREDDERPHLRYQC
jgi:hypothetical protein